MIGYLLDTYIQAFTLTAEAQETGKVSLRCPLARCVNIGTSAPASIGRFHHGRDAYDVDDRAIPLGPSRAEHRIATEQVAMRSAFNALNSP